MDYAAYLMALIPIVDTQKFTGNMPDDPDTCIVGYMDGGESPDYYFGGNKLSHPYLRIKTRAMAYEDARVLAATTIATLDGYHDGQVRGVLLREEGFSEGKDEKGRSQFTLKFLVII